MTLEAGHGMQALDKRSLTIFQKFVFVSLVVLTLLTMYVLINCSNMNTAEKQNQALKHFEELTAQLKVHHDENLN